MEQMEHLHDFTHGDDLWMKVKIMQWTHNDICLTEHLHPLERQKPLHWFKGFHYMQIVCTVAHFSFYTLNMINILWLPSISLPVSPFYTRSKLQHKTETLCWWGVRTMNDGRPVPCRWQYTFKPKRRGVTLDQVAFGAVLGAQSWAWPHRQRGRGGGGNKKRWRRRKVREENTSVKGARV